MVMTMMIAERPVNNTVNGKHHTVVMKENCRSPSVSPPTSSLPEPMEQAEVAPTLAASVPSVPSAPPRWRLEPRAATKVLKGELHNLLTVLRANQYISASRFVEEFVDIHPLAGVFSERQARLATEEEEVLEHLSEYIQPFCDAVKGRDISAEVTGAALSALSKFLLYGFVDAQMPASGAILTLVADALMHCSFEEETDTKRSRSSLLSARSSHGQRYHNPYSNLTSVQQEEQVVLKLLDTSALAIRCALGDNLIESRCLVGLLETCLHVSHRAKRASPLLKSAAADALSQIVLGVFSGAGPAVDEARVVILRKLAQLLNPAEHGLAVTNTALTLVNIALETSSELQEEEIDVLQNDLCKYLLLASTTHNLVVLTLTLRVIFNLFDSIRNHLKVPLEVFLTSVHLRILDTAEDEEREVVLESLLEFCQEPALLNDIYLNYDCDVACTNLYEAIVAALGMVASPEGWDTATEAATGQASGANSLHGTGDTTAATKTNMNGSSQSAPASLGASNHRPKDHLPLDASSTHQTKAQHAAPATTVSTGPASLTHLNRLALEGLLATLDSIVKRSGQSNISRTASRVSITGDETDSVNDVRGQEQLRRQVSHEELLERKITKQALSKVAIAFNADAMGKEWMDLAVEEKQLGADRSARGVAELLFMAPGLDKVEVGVYLSKGPEKDYPFQAEVRQQFASLFDYTGLTFAASLRKFLSKFRLPGEAQCIDRLMEAFSSELYKQQVEGSFFKNSDAVYVLSFSTIMLNTDLHNPTIKTDSRMTLKQFIRNNRGINGGEDLPEDFLTELYEQIKDKQIQVRREMGEVMMKQENVDFRTAWENILSKSHEVAKPCFTPARDARRTSMMANVHDKEMFAVLAKWLLPCLGGVFLRSWDDALVVKAMRGMQQMAKLAARFELDWVINDVLEALLPMGRDYTMGCVALDYAAVHENASTTSNGPTVVSTETGAEEDDTTVFDADHPIPFGLLSSHDGKTEPDIYGSAAHRGILALDCSFVLLRKYGPRVTTAWPGFIECLCALRDARALPAGLADLDDFADSSGNVLPLSIFAKNSQRRLEEYYRSKADPDANQQKGWFRSFFRKSGMEKGLDALDDEDFVSQRKGDLSTYARTLLGIAESADVETVIQMGSTKFPAAEQTIRALLNAVEQYPYGEDPVLEQHAIFSLELAARALLSNKEQAPELYPMFLTAFEGILSPIDEKNIPAPFVLERVAVTVLRACIHLYEVPELRPQLRTSLHLLMMVLPKTFIRRIADRLACGLAIILRSSFQYFETANEWSFIADSLDTLANFDNARVFVFDGIASTVEYVLPSELSDGLEESSVSSMNGVAPELSAEACKALSKVLLRFVLGFYKNDLSLCVPAMLCLEKLYQNEVELLCREAAEKDSTAPPMDPTTAAPDKELWQNIVVAVYTVCRSTDSEVSRHGAECLRRIVLSTAIDEIPDDKWIDILFLMANKQPPLVASNSRVNTFAVLGELLSRLLPVLSHRSDNREDLEDLINSTASLAAENLRQGRRGKVSPLFEKTLQTVTYLSNHMETDDWMGETEFSSWASETLLAELEKIGAAGASIKNQAAVQPASSKAEQAPSETAAKAEESINS